MSQNPEDCYDDTNQQRLYTFDKLCGLPDFVKHASIEPKAEIMQLPYAVFADPANMKYPCHTKEATFLANAYFQANKPRYAVKKAAEIQNRLNGFVDHWAIAGDIGHYNRKWEKAASGEPQTEIPDADYAIVAEIDGHVMRRLPMTNALSVKVAGEYLFKHRVKFPYAMRKQAARKILLKVSEFQTKLEAGEKVAGLDELEFDPETASYIEKAAGFGAAHPLYVAEKLTQRVLMLGHSNPDFRIKLGELAVVVRDMDRIEPAFLSKIAAAVDEVDRDSGIYKHYDLGVELPEEMFFPVLAKEAAETLAEYITLQTGTVMAVSSLLDLPLEKISAVMGQEFSDAVANDTGYGVDPIKMAEIAPTLPRDEAALLERAIAACVKQASMEKEARGQGARGTGYVFDDDDFSKDKIQDYFKAKGMKLMNADFSVRIKPNQEVAVEHGSLVPSLDKKADLVGKVQQAGKAFNRGSESLGGAAQKLLNKISDKHQVGSKVTDALGHLASKGHTGQGLLGGGLIGVGAGATGLGLHAAMKSNDE